MTLHPSVSSQSVSVYNGEGVTGTMAIVVLTSRDAAASVLSADLNLIEIVCPHYPIDNLNSPFFDFLRDPLPHFYIFFTLQKSIIASTLFGNKPAL